MQICSFFILFFGFASLFLYLTNLLVLYFFKFSYQTHVGLVFPLNYPFRACFSNWLAGLYKITWHHWRACNFLGFVNCSSLRLDTWWPRVLWRFVYSCFAAVIACSLKRWLLPRQLGAIGVHISQQGSNAPFLVIVVNCCCRCYQTYRFFVSADGNCVFLLIKAERTRVTSQVLCVSSQTIRWIKRVSTIRKKHWVSPLFFIV